MTDLKGKIIVITGGARGLGQATAKSCAEAGAQVFVAARTQSELDQCKNSFPCETVRTDVTRDKDLESLFARARQRGIVHGVICAAGVYGDIGPFVETSLEKWREAIEINLFGTVKTIHFALPTMKRGGRLILYSGGGQASLPNFSSYATSKGAIWRLTETLAAEFESLGIAINAIAPGAVNTRFLEDLLAAGPAKVGNEIYRKSIQQKESGGQSPQKAVDLTLYLLSERSQGITGRTLSAIWDDFENISSKDYQDKDLFRFRRVTDAKGGTRS